MCDVDLVPNEQICPLYSHKLKAKWCILNLILTVWEICVFLKNFKQIWFLGFFGVYFALWCM